ncbi:MAG TPA: phosphoadenylyl-sulfate reductase, partial [Polaromonas sp.]|nr:phosphoadenylyl-sulfate reductase [Polaromonas sp.]
MNAISLYAKPSANFAQKLNASKALLQSAAAQYAPLTQASSLGAEDMVVSHLILEAGIASSIFVLDTRMLHAQTLALVGRLEERYGVQVDVYQPDPVVTEKFVAEFGNDAMYKSLELRKACCDFRKMVPLERALAGKKGWITGLRREQSSARAEVHDIEPQAERAKINPLAD